jgi:hypothetical protein
VSLDVSEELLAQAETGDVDAGEFVECVRTSLPYAWQTIAGLVGDLESAGGEYADNLVPPADEASRGQLLRALASDSIRSALEGHFGVTLAFQNCHRVAVFPAGAETGDTYRRFISPRAQLLNQSPVLRDC